MLRACVSLHCIFNLLLRRVKKEMVGGFLELQSIDIVFIICQHTKSLLPQIDKEQEYFLV